MGGEEGEHMMGGEEGEHMGSGVPGHVEISPEGTQFDPPVLPEQIPQGAWMCNMGTVHYVAMEPGDGSCPVCGMHLTQQQGDGGGSGHEAHGH